MVATRSWRSSQVPESAFFPSPLHLELFLFTKQSGGPGPQNCRQVSQHWCASCRRAPGLLLGARARPLVCGWTPRTVHCQCLGPLASPRAATQRHDARAIFGGVEQNPSAPGARAGSQGRSAGPEVNSGSELFSPPGKCAAVGSLKETEDLAGSASSAEGTTRRAWGSGTRHLSEGAAT